MVQESKKALRREMKVVLANLDSRWIAKAHSELCFELTQLVLSLPRVHPGQRHILAWVPCFQGEVDLAEFIATMLKDSIVYLPRLDSAGSMQFVRVRDDWGAHMTAGPRGMIQPEDGYGEPFVVPEASDVYVIVPGLAFDHVGQRLGRGAGHYDRFLATPGLEQSVKIGVCWSMQIVQTVPTDPYDIQMDWICYERGLMKVNSHVQTEEPGNE
jgi:5-formyltetrahydrofolate cyclo-ligase